MEEYNNLKKILNYILQYYTKNSDKQRISECLSKEIAYIGKAKVSEFLKWHRLMALLPPNSEIDNSILCAETYKKNQKLLYLSNELANIFKNEEISFCFLKGISLITTIYEDISISKRYFSDIDLLVAKKDLERVEYIMKTLDFRFGRVVEDQFIPATKSQVIFQKLYTHELYQYVKYVNNEPYFVDINHLFSWKGGNDSTKELRLDDIADCISLHNSISTGYNFPILNDSYQFIHLCVHFYNESMYFMLDTLYDGKDPKELRLFRLYDICFMLNKLNIDASIINNIAIELNVKNKISYVLSILVYIFGDTLDLSQLRKYFEISAINSLNTYYKKDNSLHNWPIPFSERIFAIDKRNQLTFEK